MNTVPDHEADPIGARLAQLAPGAEVAASWAMRPKAVRIGLINDVFCRLEEYPRLAGNVGDQCEGSARSHTRRRRPRLAPA
jgi:hypothetical protein